MFALLRQRRGGCSLVLAHRDELLQQAADKRRRVDDTMAMGIVKATQDVHNAPIVIASVPTLSRPQRLERLTPDVATVVIDEAHHAPAAWDLHSSEAFEAELVEAERYGPNALPLIDATILARLGIAPHEAAPAVAM